VRAGDRHPAEQAFRRELGARLRQARVNKGLSLSAAEGASGGESATGRGLVVMFEEAAKEHDLDPSEVTFALQGFGNVGSWAARILQGLGATMVAASDARGAIRCDSGIDAEKLEGYDTMSAADGVMALEILGRCRFDAILLDTVMPRMDGLTVLRTLRSDPDTADTPVLVLSGLADIAHLERAVEAGASGYVTKPFEIRGLLEQISRLTRPTKRMRRQ